MKRITWLLLIMISILSCTKNTDTMSRATAVKQNPDRPAVAVETAEVALGHLIPFVKTSGVLRGGNEAYAVLQSQGIIREVRFRLGDRVEQGDLLVVVDDTLIKASLELAEQQYQTALLDYQAASKAQVRGGLSALELSRSKGRMISARVNRDRAQKSLEDCRLRAPISGFVTSRDPAITVGNLASPGTRAASIVDISSYRMEVAVGEGVVGLIEPGMTAEIRLSDSGALLSDRARVEAVAPGSNLSSGSYSVVLVWKTNEMPALPGMTVSATILRTSEKEQLLIPASAVLYREDRSFVYLEQDGLAQPQFVQIEERSGTVIAVENGVREGDHLILTGLISLVPGAPVIPTLVGTTAEVR